MAKMLTTSDLRKIYLKELKKDVKRKTLLTFFLAAVATIGIFFVDTATNPNRIEDEEIFK